VSDSDLMQRITTLETFRIEDEKRLSKIEQAVEKIQGIGWAIFGVVAVQAIVSVTVLFSRRMFP
jgi:hypothetical protein